MEPDTKADRGLLPALDTSSTYFSNATSETNSNARGNAPTQIQTLFNAWAFEFIWILVSLSSFSVILVVLLIYDGRALPRLPLNITLNTLVAFFSSLSKAAFMIPVAEAISQCKWNWFRTDKPLSDFETFDVASRGFWGSVTLLGRLRWRQAVHRRYNIASLGALVTIFSIMSTPITQQLIAYPTRLGPAVDVNNPTTAAVRAWAIDPSAGPRGPSNTVLSTVLNGFLTRVDDPIQPLGVSCPTGQCTFPRFNSLGICVKMENITSSLNVQETPPDPNSWPLQLLLTNVTRQYDVSLGGECNMTSPSTIAFRTCRSQANESFAFQNDADMMASKVYSFPVMYSMIDKDTFASPDDPGPVRWGAMEVFYHLCVNTYEISVRGGSLSSVPVSSSWKTPGNGTNKPLAITCNEMTKSDDPVQCIVPEEDKAADVNSFIALTDPSSSNNRTSDFRAQRTLLNILVDSLHYSSEGLYMYDPTDNSDNGWTISSGITQMVEALYNNGDRFFNESLPLDPQVQFGRIGVMMNSVATSLTNLMRSTPSYTSADTTTHFNAQPITGSAWANETFVSVRWGWIFYMASEIVAAALFLCLTVVATSQLDIKVLKSSPLATLLALNDKTRSTVGGITTPSEVRHHARSVKVNLVDGGKDGMTAGFATSPLSSEAPVRGGGDGKGMS
ncbi:hypothetical protein B0T19DRAFT_462302 [Cercophora scortea]|uniref:Uncharacterized protein n=1 Tax=Cercophora scortea TaxID=314031 RepID=A0AAE0MDK8_9PEZI|nr:hypothetical protein B0T19DRAFT_462302 [Cercophora scortea]